MPNSETLALEDLSFWSLPIDKQTEIKDAIPHHDTWCLDCYRSKEGYWFFDLPLYGVKAEAFINGTQLALDWYYTKKSGVKPDEFSKMTIMVSSEDLPVSDTTVLFKREDPLSAASHYYWDPTSELDVWLCPFNQYLFGRVPETLSLHFEPYF